jgi:hypothetical protein
MASNVKKIQKMYEEYMRENLTKMDKHEVIQQFVEAVLGITDLNNPEVYKQIVEILLRYEQRKAKAAALEAEGLGEEEDEELDMSGMHLPKDFADLKHQLKLLSVNSELHMRDISNAIALTKQIEPYMFDMEVPRVGTINDVLCFTWGLEEAKMAVISFVDGNTLLEVTDKQESIVLEVVEGLKDEEIVMIARLADYAR